MIRGHKAAALGAMTGHDPSLDIAENYRRFARLEAAGRSPAYATLAEAVAEDEAVVAFLKTLPVGKRQPNLVFAVARFLLGRPADITSLRALVAERADELNLQIRHRRTQTNEAARCAVLLPALARVRGPLALLEVGAAAGLTLMVDYFSYDYDGHYLEGSDAEAPTLACELDGPVPLPEHMPEVVWRAGIDLHPLDVGDADDVHWLSCLVWPGEADREDRLAAALATARRHPPTVHRGDLVGDLVRVASEAPKDATLVVYHSAVLAYVGQTKRNAFASAVHDLGAVWLSNEGPGIVPVRDNTAAPPRTGGSFALVQDGRELLAFTDPHGTWLSWSA